MYFGDLEGVVTYFDDLLIAPDATEEHNKMLGEVVKCEIKFHESKMQYCQREVKFIGFKFKNKVMFPDEDRIKKVNAMQ